MIRARFPLLLAFASFGILPLAALTGCNNKPPKTALSYSADAKRAYDEAMEEFNSHNWLEAQAQMRDVKRKYSYSKYAKLAELRIADADFEQEKYADAIRGYRQFVHDHRSDNEEVSYARSRIAEAEYKQVPDSFLLPAGEERDQASVIEAYKELRAFLQDYPNAKEAAKIRELLADVTARLVRHELYVARFYLNRDNFDAAVARVQYALRTYGPSVGPKGEVSVGSGLEPEALLLLGETYLRMKKYSEAKQSFAAIVQRYPASAIVRSARGYLSYMTERGI